MTAGRYNDQVALLVRTLPEIAHEPIFALKGGTAINLFIRDLPRLSIDIDLVYLPVGDRDASLTAIADGLERIAERLERRQGLHVERRLLVDGKRLILRDDVATIKIEVSPVLRGTVFSPETRAVSAKVQARFGFAEMPLVSLADLYAGKIAAALDRQHPRDLFDVHYLLMGEGIDDRLFNTFLVYLVSHPRPAHELLSPNRLDIAAHYNDEFLGMTVETVPFAALIEARERLFDEIHRRACAAHSRQFLVSFHSLDPDWGAIGHEGNLAELPAVRWKLQNLERLRRENPGKFADQQEKLVACLGGASSDI